MSKRFRYAGVIALAIGAAGAALFFRRARLSPSVSSVSMESSAPHEPSLLDQLRSPENGPGNKDNGLSGPVATNKQLEQQFILIAQNQQEVEALKYRAAAAAAKKNLDVLKANLEEGKIQVQWLNLRLPAFEKDLAAARQSRPNDPVVQWLTGELLTMVGGEPEQILPYFRRAHESGLQRPELLASLAKIDFDLNHFQIAFDTAEQSLGLDARNRAAWPIYSRAGFALERFNAVSQKMQQAFPANPPDWARAIQQNARRLQTAWLREMEQRKKEDASANLPLVRLTIEHRAFAGNEIKASGRGDVVITLFENEAPSTVANFIHLAETGFYDGTLFYWAEAGHMVVGGDPNTKNDNPSDDGTGGPGYVIPDEYNLPAARPHFRGTISTVQNGPGKAGSQFFITLVPTPEFDGNSTAFGRVTQGQQVLDQVTQGRTNRKVGEFGKLIPGDRIVRVEVVRKRPHAYTVTRLNAR